jgi:hypothetical protein
LPLSNGVFRQSEFVSAIFASANRGCSICYDSDKTCAGSFQNTITDEILAALR